MPRREGYSIRRIVFPASKSISPARSKVDCIHRGGFQRHTAHAAQPFHFELEGVIFELHEVIGEVQKVIFEVQEIIVSFRRPL